MRRLLLLLLLLPPTLWAQSAYTTHPQCRKVREMTVLTVVPGGNDMNTQEVVAFNDEGVAVSVTRRGFGGEHTYPLQPTDCRVVMDADGDTAEVHTATYSAYYVYRKPHVRSAAKVYHYRDCVVAHYRVMTYNRRGDVVQCRRFSPDDLLEERVRYRYTYDAEGNWTARDYILNGKLRYTVTRQIRYAD